MSKVSLTKLMNRDDFNRAKQRVAREFSNAKNLTKKSRAEQFSDLIDEVADPETEFQATYAQYLSDMPKNQDIEMGETPRFEIRIPIELPVDLRTSIDVNPLLSSEIEEINQNIKALTIHDSSNENCVPLWGRLERSEHPGSFDVVYSCSALMLSPILEYLPNGKFSRTIPRPLLDEVESAIGAYMEPTNDNVSVYRVPSHEELQAGLKRAHKEHSAYERSNLQQFYGYRVTLAEPTLDLSDLNDKGMEL